VDLILAHLNSYASAYLRRTLDTQQTVVIEMNAGESIPSAKADHPYLFRSTLNLWEANVALGVWAAEHIGKRAVVCTSDYNAGFGFHEAFRHGFESAGGELLRTRVTNALTNSDQTMGAIDELRELNPDVLFASYSSHDARYFMQLYRSSGLAIPVLGTNFRDEVHARGESDRGFDAWSRTHAYATSWSPELATEENIAFLQSYREKTGLPANAYVILGYDTAQLLLRALTPMTGTGPEAIRRALASAQTSGPRGVVTMDAQSQSTTCTTYMVAGGVEADRVVPMPVDAATLYALRVHHAETPAGGWLNAYEFA
jgi:ABC-type branched-subunit amino acid transport system substrate-binding protein